MCDVFDKVTLWLAVFFGNEIRRLSETSKWIRQNALDLRPLLLLRQLGNIC